MFGGDLAETIKYESRKGGGCVPIIMQRCIDKIRQDGKKTCEIINKLLYTI